MYAIICPIYSEASSGSLHHYESLPQNYVQIFKMYAWKILKTELIASFGLLLHSLSRKF